MSDSRLADAAAPVAGGAVLGFDEWGLDDLAFEPYADEADQTAGERITLFVKGIPSSAGFGAVLAAASDLGRLNLDERIDFLVLVDKLRSQLDALQHRALAAMDSADRSELRWSAEQSAAALRLSPRCMPRRFAIASTLTRELPETLEALSSGTINGSQANEIATASWTLSRDVVPVFESLVLSQAAGQTLPETRRAVAQAVLLADPHNQQERHAKAVEDRSVVFCPLSDGMASLTMLGRAIDTEAIYSRLTDATTLLPADDSRTRDQQRADLFVDAILTGIPVGALPRRHRRQQQVNVHVGLSTLLGADERPGWLDGYGPLAAGTLRQIAHQAGSTWRRLVSDPISGTVLEYGRTTYRPPKPLVDLVIARDVECSAPGCHVPARSSDIDHVRAWTRAGHTAPDNHAPLCRRHHQLKTRGPFRYSRAPDGSCTWTLGSRHSYTSQPPVRIPRPPDLDWAKRLDALAAERLARERLAQDRAYEAACGAIQRDLAAIQDESAARQRTSPSGLESGRSETELAGQAKARTALRQLAATRASQLRCRSEQDARIAVERAGCHAQGTRRSGDIEQPAEGGDPPY